MRVGCGSEPAGRRGLLRLLLRRLLVVIHREFKQLFELQHVCLLRERRGGGSRVGPGRLHP